MGFLSGENTFLIGISIVLVFLIWKYLIEPINNEGKKLEYDEDDYKHDCKPLIDLGDINNNNFDLGIEKSNIDF